ncbi:TPA: fimbrial biogenesis outer membrane usher protein [Escherichia coli]|nr:fimbrial biogenesis outer membrane usher protein [Escherichia coli]
MRGKLFPLSVFLFIQNSYSEELAVNYSFEPAFITMGDKYNKNIPNLKYFSRADSFLPGEYSVDIVLNNENLGKEKVVFEPVNSGKVVPRFSTAILKSWGIDTDSMNLLNESILSSELKNKIDGFSSTFDKNKQILYINIPQKWIYRPVWSEMPPQSWDNGETALLLNYRYSNIRNRYNSGTKENQTLSVNTGLNIGGWRIRHNGYWNTNKQGWTNLSTFARHDYSFGQGGQLTIGQTSTEDGILDSFPYEGISIASDDGMIVPWMSTYSPIVRGIAYTPAQVIIKQNNIMIWQGDVPAGPFELQDVFPLYGGNMEIEIHESNGEIRRYTQVSSTLPILQREGRFRYHAAVGKYRNVGNNNGDKPTFLQYSGAWGVGWDTTVYGGFIAANTYNSVVVGLGKYMPLLGAISLDFSHSLSDSFLRNSSVKEQGQRTRLTYSRGFESTGTDLSVTGNWYNSSEYYSFNDYQQNKNSNDYLYSHRSRYNISANLQQSIGNAGQITLTADLNNYRNEDNGQLYRLAYFAPINNISTSLSFTYNKQPQYNNIDKVIFASVSVPFSVFSDYNTAYLTTNAYNAKNTADIQTGVSGSLLEQKLYYSIMEGYHNGDENSNSGNATIRYKSAKGEIQSTWSHNKQARQLLLSANGGIVLHSGGLLLTQTLALDGANALIDTNGVGNIKIKRGIGLYTDQNGYAVVPNLVPYQKNSIALDVNKVSATAEIIKSNTFVTPSKGALVRAKFNVVSGHKALISLVRPNGDVVPFGSLTSLRGDHSNQGITGIVSDNGQVWMSGLPDKGELLAQWGDDGKSTCNAPFSFNKDKNNLSMITLVCK